MTYRPNPHCFLSFLWCVWFLLLLLPNLTCFHKYSYIVGAQPLPLFIIIDDCFFLLQ